MTYSNTVILFAMIYCCIKFQYCPALELGVDNPNINEVIRIGCPCNIRVLLQELGRAGRKPGSVATGALLFNEVIDDKHLGLWLRSSLESKEVNPAVVRAKSEMINTYVCSSMEVYIFHIPWKMLG